MSDVKHHWHIQGLHNAEAQHIHHKVVVPEAGAALTQDHLVVTGFPTLRNDVLHFLWRQELGLLDIDDRSGFCHGNNKIRLSAQESRQLDDIANFCGRCSLPGFVNIGNDRNTELALDVCQDLQPLLKTGAAEGTHGRAVSLVE